MSSLRNRGAGLPLVVSLMCIVVAIGLLFFYFTMFQGGRDELQDATDSGALNVAKQSETQVGVQLLPGVEQDNFGTLVNPPTTGLVTLQNYNQIVGQAIIVALQAQQSGSSGAIANATAVVNAAQGHGGIGQRLAAALASNTTGAIGYFSTVAQANNARMLGSKTTITPVSGSYQVGYMNRWSVNNLSAASNLSINPSQPLFKNLPLSTVQDPNNPGNFYLAGYTPITFGNTGIPPIQAVTMNPGQKVHLVSTSDFQNSMTSPALGANGSLVPPNAFQSAAISTVADVNKQMQATAVAIVNSSQAVVSAVGGGTNSGIPPIVPIIGGLLGGPSGGTTTTTGGTAPPVMNIQGGYVRIVNLPGIQYGGPQNTSTANPLNNELFSGVYVASNGAFSTSQAALQNWIAYNSGQTKTQPPIPQTIGGQVVFIFDQNGNYATLPVLQKITAMNSPCSECTYLNTSGPGEVPICVGSLPAFMTAYGYNVEQQMSSETLIAVEYEKAALIDLYAALLNNASVNGINNFMQLSGTISGSNAPTTGLRKFNESGAIYNISLNQASSQASNQPVANEFSLITNQTIQFSTPGSVLDYLSQIDSSGSTIMSSGTATLVGLVTATNGVLQQITTALQLVNPAVTQAQVQQALASQPSVNLSTTFYLGFDANNNLVFSQTPPPGTDINQVADGRSTTYSSLPYNLVGNIVDTPGDLGILAQMFTMYSVVMGAADSDELNRIQSGAPPVSGNANPGTGLQGIDAVVVTPNSGNKNLLLNVQFQENATGADSFTCLN